MGFGEMNNCSHRYEEFPSNCGPSKCHLFCSLSHQRKAINRWPATAVLLLSTGTAVLPPPHPQTEGRQWWDSVWAHTACQQEERAERGVSTRTNPRQGTDTGNRGRSRSAVRVCQRRPFKKLVLLPFWRAISVLEPVSLAGKLRHWTC